MRQLRESLSGTENLAADSEIRESNMRARNIRTLSCLRHQQVNEDHAWCRRNIATEQVENADMTRDDRGPISFDIPLHGQEKTC